MYRWLVVGLVGSIVIPVSIIAFMGVNPRPVRIINPSEFSEAAAIGAAIYRRLYGDLNESSIVVVGSEPSILSQRLIWDGLVQTAENYGHFFHQKTWPSHSPQDFFAEIAEILKNNEKVIVRTTADYASHVSSESLSVILEKKFAFLPLTFTQAVFALKQEELVALKPSCLENQSPLSPNCQSVNISRRYLHKKYDSHKIMAAVEKVGQNDYMIFVHEPKDRP